MDERFTFNEDVGNYEKWRPTYCINFAYLIVPSKGD